MRTLYKLLNLPGNFGKRRPSLRKCHTISWVRQGMLTQKCIGYKARLLALIFVSAATAQAANSLPVPANGVYLGIQANPGLASNQELATEILEGPVSNGINHTFALHLAYYKWGDIAAMLDSNAIFQPDVNLAGDISHGRVPVISWGCDQKVANSDSVIAAGAASEDAIITSTANALKQYSGPVLLRWFWEFNDLSNNQTCRGDTGGAPTAQVYNGFIGAWQHIWTLFQKAGATNVVFLWNPGDYSGNANKDPQGFYPGNGYVDWIGIDTYQRATGDSFVTDFGQFYSDFTASQYGNKPLMVGENAAQGYSVGNSEIQAGYLQGLLADIKNGTFPQLKAYDYFDSPGNAPNNWVLDAQGGLAEFATIANSGAFVLGPVNTPVVPFISKVANAEGEAPLIAPNTWVEVKGSNLAPALDTRIWQGSDFVNNQMPTSLDGVSVTVNGLAAYVYYISPSQINILTPPNLGNGAVQVAVTNNNIVSASFTVQAQSISPSFFVLSDGQHLAAEHANGTLIGPASLSVPGYTFTPAQPGETVVLYANGFGATTPQVVNGSESQSGSLSTNPTVTIGGTAAHVMFAGLISPGLFQFNVVVPLNTPGGDEPIIASYNGQTTQSAALLTLTGTAPPPTSVTYYVAPNGNDTWSGTLAAPNGAGTDGPFATFNHARAAVQSLNKKGLTQVTVLFRAGTYYLPQTIQFTAADSGTSSLSIVYQNFPGETPVISGGMRVTNWTNVTGNTWKVTLPTSTQYFENLFYNGVRRLRPRPGGAVGAFYRVANTVYLSNPGPPAAAPNANCAVYISGSGWECFDRFQYNPSDPISGSWKNLAPAAGNPCGQAAGNQAIVGDIEVLDFEQNITSKLRIGCIDTTNHIAYMTGPTSFTQNNPGRSGFIAGNRYLVDNVEDYLTLPGQWFLDRSTTSWTLTYLANPGENPNTDLVIVPQISQVLVASQLEYVTFRGLTFEHDNYTIPAAGHPSTELEPDITAAVSFQNSQYITFDSGTVTQVSGTGIEFISCVAPASPAYCASIASGGATGYNTIENSAIFDIGVLGIRIGDPYVPANTDANVPQSFLVQNNVVEGYGRTIPASFGIGQGEGHDNVYTHNDVYDGYHCAISISEEATNTTKLDSIGNANNIISFNHVYNLLQGIMNDAGSIRILAGNGAHTPPGNKILNNKVHDTTDASIQDSNGYGGDGIYLDNQTGLVQVENNLVYRVSASAVEMVQGPSLPNQANTIQNNILAYARIAMVRISTPYPNGVPTAITQNAVVENNLFYFDRAFTSNPSFMVQGGCLYAGGVAYTQFQEWSSNMYWRTDGAFAADLKAFAVQPSPATGNNAPCATNSNKFTFYTFAQWQTQEAEDAQSLVQNPGFNNPTYPADDYSLSKGSPGVGFVVFDPTQAGRSNPVINPPAVPATFLTMTYNPATGY